MVPKGDKEAGQLGTWLRDLPPGQHAGFQRGFTLTSQRDLAGQVTSFNLGVVSLFVHKIRLKIAPSRVRVRIKWLGKVMFSADVHQLQLSTRTAKCPLPRAVQGTIFP